MRPLLYVQNQVRSFISGISDDELTIKEKEALLGYALIIPSILAIGSIIIYPLIYNIYLSFTTIPVNPTAAPEWIGLGHYQDLIGSEEYWSSLITSIIYTIGTALLATVGGLFVAVLFNRNFRGGRILRSLVVLPFVAPVIAIAISWKWMLDPLRGYIPYILTQELGLIESPDVFADPNLAIWGAIVFSAWRYFPFAYLFLFARLQAIDESLYEAAKLDGATKFAQFKDITLHNLRSALAIVFLLRCIWQFNVYEDVWLVTHQVQTLPIYTYQTAFSVFQQGRGAAISVTLLIFLLIFLMIYSRFVTKSESEEVA